MSKITPDMLKKKDVFDIDGNKIGIIHDVIREKYKLISADFLEVELTKRIKIGPRDLVKVRTRDAELMPDGNVKVKFTKEKLKIMMKEQELQKHPPTV
ncbi:MAG: hypothetical protein FK731_10010 [Asgard group archaeon]|nr:hypothetical protein [Asgard group archaeon]